MPGTYRTAKPQKAWKCATAALLLAACHTAGRDSERSETGVGSSLEAGLSPRAADASGQPSLTDAAGPDDLEKYTNERFGVSDGPIEWADLGPADHRFDGCNTK